MPFSAVLKLKLLIPLVAVSASGCSFYLAQTRTEYGEPEAGTQEQRERGPWAYEVERSGEHVVLTLESQDLCLSRSVTRVPKTRHFEPSIAGIALDYGAGALLTGLAVYSAIQASTASSTPTITDDGSEDLSPKAEGFLWAGIAVVPGIALLAAGILGTAAGKSERKLRPDVTEEGEWQKSACNQKAVDYDTVRITLLETELFEGPVSDGRVALQTEEVIQALSKQWDRVVATDDRQETAPGEVLPGDGVGVAEVPLSPELVTSALGGREAVAERIHKIREEQAFADATSVGSLKAYAAFLREYPDGEFAEEASAAVRNRAEEAASVFVAEYKEDFEANWLDDSYDYPSPLIRDLVSPRLIEYHRRKAQPLSKSKSVGHLREAAAHYYATHRFMSSKADEQPQWYKRELRRLASHVRNTIPVQKLDELLATLAYHPTVHPDPDNWHPIYSDPKSLVGERFFIGARYWRNIGDDWLLQDGTVSYRIDFAHPGVEPDKLEGIEQMFAPPVIDVVFLGKMTGFGKMRGVEGNMAHTRVFRVYWVSQERQFRWPDL